MNPLSDESILSLVAKMPQSRGSYKQLARELSLRNQDRRGLDESVRRLVRKGALIELRGGNLILASASREYAAGRLSVHRDGFGFVIPDPPREDIQGDIFIPPESLNGAMHNDRVVARIARIGRDNRAEGGIYEILDRHHQTVVGQFRLQKRGAFVKPYNERLKHWIIIPEGLEIPPPSEQRDRLGLSPPTRDYTLEQMHGLVVNVQLLEYPDDDQAPVGRIIEILGDPEAFGIDVEITIRKFQIPHEFPPDVLVEARDAQPVALEDRRDFRHLPIVTIDGETARDFDDAILVRRLPNQNFELQVHIADVSHYVKMGTSIDREARQRGTSVYFPDRAVPMLPVELSTDLCSLRPNEDRAVLSAILEISPQGDTVKQEFCRGLIRSAARMTYIKVHLILEGSAENPLTEQYRSEYAHLRHEFDTARDLALALMAKRRRRGSIDFDLPEPLIEFSPDGEMTGILRHPRNIAHRLIEELMLAANEAVAAHLERLDIPSVYRIHDPPNPAKVLEFQEAAAEFGYKLDAAEIQARRFQQVKRTRDGRKVRKQIDVVDSINTVPSTAYQKLVAQIEGKPEERIISYLLLRSMKQARYSAENKGHYALAADSYTHFTSPIRRYPDLIVHRLLTAWLLGQEPPYSTEELVELAEHCSMTERRAADAERELVEWKKAKFMNDRVGQEFDGLITNTSRWGCFVELNDLYVEGLIPIESLGKEKFGFEERTRRILGQRSGREFRIGQPVRIMLERVDEMEKRLQFALVDSPGAAARRASTRRPRY